MENSVNFSVDLSTESGKKILAAVNAVINGSAAPVVTAAKVKVEAPKAEAKVVPLPTAPVANVLPISVPQTTVAPSIPVAAPTIPSAPKAPTAPAAPKAPAPAAPKAPAPVVTAPAAPKVKAPVVAFESLDEEGKREAVKKLTTKWSKKGKTTDIKSLFAAYGATNVESVDAGYLDHFNWAMTTFDTNGQDMAAVLGTFGAQ